MFTGIIECMGIVKGVRDEKGNKRFRIQSSISNELSIDQSVAHQGVCLTVVAVKDDSHDVVAVGETLSKTNLGKFKIGDYVNIERCLKMGDRLDGHVVQGHVDGMATCVKRQETSGSWLFTFELDKNLNEKLVVEKGSIAVNGVSLTAFNLSKKQFSVAIIPYTFAHTTFYEIELHDKVNIEFDILGKYVSRWNEK